MTHRHKYGELITTFFVATRNSDQTEGRGHQVEIDSFDNYKDAYLSAKGEGVMGVGDGDVLMRTYHRCEDCPALIKTDKTIYYGGPYTQKNTLGKGTYADYMPDGWHRDYSAMAQDPEYADYLRLKNKFENN